MRIHLHLPRLASCLFWPIAKSGIKHQNVTAVFEMLIAELGAGVSVRQI